ncbi:MAG: phosphoglycerate kinase [bacterium]|nr:phosphoglycerate kinase [bacterium]
MELRTLKDLDVAGKQVIVRVDFNVPCRDGKVCDATRIKAALPTIEYLKSQRCRIVLLTHLGKPNNAHDVHLSLRQVFDYLAERLPSVQFAPQIPGTAEAITRSKAIREGDVVLFENLRFNPGEAKDDPAFAASLAAIGDVVVNDAFSVSHRKAASVSTLLTLLPSAAGFQLEKEVTFLGSAIAKPKRPLVAIIGGAKISTKLPVIRALLQHCDYVLLGGALANTMLKAQGIAVGKSLIEESMVADVKDLSLTTNKLRVPIDVVMAVRPEAGVPVTTTAVANVPDDQLILDIGPETLDLYAMIVKTAGTIVWNGPMGYFELPEFAKGTDNLAKLVSETHAVTIAGGGETLDAINALQLGSKFTFLSTGGGAMLKFLEGKPMPGITPLLKTS